MAVYNLSGRQIGSVFSLMGVMASEAFDIDQRMIFPDGEVLVPVFEANFSGYHPSPEQFYSWEGRDYSNAIYDATENIDIIDGVLHLKTEYDQTRSRWIEQMITTGGLFEADNFRCSFRARFENIPGAWQNVITYGTGIHWTNGLYSDGVKWPSGGEIDAFEQAGGYSATPTTFRPIFHYGAGTESGYPHNHETLSIGSAQLETDKWARYRFDVFNGVVSIYVNGELVAQGDGSQLTVNNNYLWNYKPFTKPQAFYLDCGVAGTNASIDTNNRYDFQISDFKVLQEENVQCTGISIFPQMWARNTSITFPVNAELYLDRQYTPANTSNKACTWASSNPSVATVCQGYVRTLSTGSSTITATCGERTATYTVNVSANPNVPCAGVVINTNFALLLPSRTVDIGSVIYKYPTFTTNSVTLTSSNTSIARVSGTVITGVNYGTANITVRCGNATASIPVTVTDGNLLDADITLSTSGDVNIISNDPFEYDFTQVYSIQYTFGTYSPTSQASATVNCIVGPVLASNARRAGSVSYVAGQQKWEAQISGSAVDITPGNNTKVTFVLNFPNSTLSIYQGATAIVTNATLYRDYVLETARLIAGRENSTMTVAPKHIKIALGDIH